MYEKVLKASDIVWCLRRQWSQLRKQKDARKAHGNTQCEHLVTYKYQSVKWNRGYVTHGIEATCASPNGIEAKCASPRWRPNPEIDWHRDRYPRDMINPAGRNHVNRERSPSSNAIRGMRRYLTKQCTDTLILAFISSRVDCCHHLLYVLPTYQL